MLFVSGSNLIVFMLKVLIVSTRYLGDSLLAASLAKPIKDIHPDAQVDVLTFKSNRHILNGVSGVDNLILVEQRPSKTDQAKQLLSLWNKYDWAVITQESTRAALYGYFAAKKQSILTIDKSNKGLWKRLLLTHQVPRVQGHWLDGSAQLLIPVIGTVPKVSPQTPRLDPLPEDLNSLLSNEPYVVCHTQSRYCDKNWSVSGWRALIQECLSHNLKVVFTGGSAETEIGYIKDVIKDFPSDKVLNVAGSLSFNQTATLIKNAKVYVGVDTATSHVAAATGTPCVCLYGPTDAVVWGPSPTVRNGLYSNDQAIQTLGNVTIIRNKDYLHCYQCSRHHCPLHTSNTSLGHCLQMLSHEEVWKAISLHL